jgi:hypothetical protein
MTKGQNIVKINGLVWKRSAVCIVVGERDFNFFYLIFIFFNNNQQQNILIFFSFYITSIFF